MNIHNLEIIYIQYNIVLHVIIIFLERSRFVACRQMFKVTINSRNHPATDYAVQYLLYKPRTILELFHRFSHSKFIEWLRGRSRFIQWTVRVRLTRVCLLTRRYCQTSRKNVWKMVRVRRAQDRRNVCKQGMEYRRENSALGRGRRIPMRE